MGASNQRTIMGEGLTVPRSQARTHFAASCIRNHRLSIYNGVTAVWRTIPIRIWRGSSSRLRSPLTALYICSSCSKLSVPGPGKGKGVLARQITGGEGNFWTNLRGPSLIWHSSLNHLREGISPPLKIDWKRQKGGSLQRKLKSWSN